MRILLTLFFCLWFPSLAALCTGSSFMDRITEAERAQIAEAVAATPYATGLHWTATKDDKTLHLIGTMHIADPRLQSVFDRTAASVDASELLLVEATAESEAEMQAAFAANPDMIFITEGPTLPELLDEETWQTLSEAVSARMVPPFLAAKMRPWYLSLTLAIPPCVIPELTAGERGLDHMLMT
ncbi:MAG: TraB/GumN family protein, partial [Rhodobacteraceae bacterium]|nr:TraB/GumN family protein [Paracoccaceae bacterium]